mmetsp:Transcript_48678/g.95429  ORF Transcript_48678/g.95429 Transcript_48678/m.95429 type:complete len:504 (+) Transcript_48678:60-1571(+)|eukprot:CAMPEP_0175148892 /NCGR_PEP_ID=MMETSP0087-20121206/16897_1 /TAXON_ID=136419 /ORGANISM="Unknown Unknown, Strain D1" /LENGTH=503 /DNA_ID=CAMNT_0016434437 /DNA_START=59 /DNA_END=1570 /DNA_ORIENTATION=-
MSVVGNSLLMVLLCTQPIAIFGIPIFQRSQWNRLSPEEDLSQINRVHIPVSLPISDSFVESDSNVSPTALSPSSFLATDSETNSNLDFDSHLSFPSSVISGSSGLPRLSELEQSQAKPSQKNDVETETLSRKLPETNFGGRFSTTSYRARDTTKVEQSAQQTLKSYLEQTKEIASTSKNLWSLCDQQLRNLLKKSTEEQRASLAWVANQKAKALKVLGEQGAKIEEMGKQIEDVQRVHDDAVEKQNSYKLEEQKLLANNPLTHEASVRREHSLVLLDFYMKAADSMIQESISSLSTRKDELERTRNWYSKGRDSLAEWLKKQELIVNMRVSRRKSGGEKFRQQCRRLDQVFKQASLRVGHYSVALQKERYNGEMRAVKEDLFAKRQKINAAKAELNKLMHEEKVMQTSLVRLNTKMRTFKVEESQLAAPPRVWKQTIDASGVKEGSPTNLQLPPLDTVANGRSLMLKHFEFPSSPPDYAANNPVNLKMRNAVDASISADSVVL